MKQATRNFAKRQLTWFRHDDRVVWLPAEGRSAEELANEMVNIIKKRRSDVL